MEYYNYNEYRKALDNGETTCIDTVKKFLDRINNYNKLNAFISVFDDEAIATANIIDDKIKKGKAGKLAGMVISLKDVLSYKNKQMTCGSKILSGFISLYNAYAVQRLIDEDAVIIGKTNCDEFAMGSSNENSAYGPVLNPIDNSRVPGGSSGGSAASVAAGLCMASIGTDTGGSVRQPASFCGIVGFKPTYGRISRSGLTAFASSFDSIGIFANNIEDTFLILSVISGKDVSDSTTVDMELPDHYNLISKDNNFTIGIVKDIKEEGLQEEVKHANDDAVSKLKTSGYNVTEVTLPYSKFSIQAYYILTTAEASSNLARYDGVRYGLRSKDSETIEEMYVNTRTEGFGKEVKRRIMLGTYVLSHGYYDAYYKKAQKVRRLIREDYMNAFKNADLLIMPSTPTTAFRIGDKIDEPLEMYLNDIYTTSANLAGLPAVSIPYGKDISGLPIGIQLIGNAFDEGVLLNTAKILMER